MCKSAVRKKSRVCGVCVKLKNLLKIHYKNVHSSYAIHVSVSTRTRKRVKAIDYESDDETDVTCETRNQVFYSQVQPIKTEKDSDILDDDALVSSVSGKASSKRKNDVYATIPKSEEFICNLSHDNPSKDTRKSKNRNTRNEKFSCHCGKNFKTAKELRVHDSTHKTPADPVERPHACPICDRRFKSTTHLRDHKRIHGIHECFCGSTFSTKNELAKHRATHDEASRRSIMKAKRTSNESALSMDNVDAEKNMCKLCSRTFRNKYTLQAHMRLHTGEAPHVCSAGCGKSFVSKDRLRKHEMTHDSIRPHVCRLCHETFKRRGHLKEHELIHEDEKASGEKPYECIECCKKFTSEDVLKIHERTHTELSDRPYKCSTCSKSFKAKNNLKEHEFIHSEVRPFKCDFCEKAFPTMTMWNRHAKTHAEYQPREGTHKCDICNRGFICKQNLEKHERTQHAILPSFECPQCSKAFPNRQRLLVHVRSHGTLRPFVCDVCHKAFKQKAHLWDHRHLHMEKSHLCEYCGDKFISYARLKRHRQVNHEEKGFRCSYCNKGLADRPRLEEHERTHTGEKPYSCEYCAARFNNTSNLLAHIRIHTGEKPYKCSQCDFAATQRSTLVYHLYTHSGVRNFECTMCPKKFTQRAGLREHMKRHKGIKQHVCEKCNKQFVTKCELRDHYTTHSNERPFQCHFCTAAFKRKDHLLPHMRSHHPDKLDPSKLIKKSQEQSTPSKTANPEGPIPATNVEPPVEIVNQLNIPANFNTTAVLAQAQQHILQTPAHSIFGLPAEPYNIMQLPEYAALNTAASFPGFKPEGFPNQPM